MKILDGKALSKKIIEQIAKEVIVMESSKKKTPHLATILVGNDLASHTYVNNKIKACQKARFKSTLLKFNENVSENELLNKIEELNLDKDIDGFIVQFPLPAHINGKKIIESIHPDKDVDGFHPINIGKMVLNMPCYLPATPYGILQLLDYYEIETTGKQCVVIGRSHIVGLPMSILMARNSKRANCTVTLAHSKTRNLKKITQMADILIVAIGKIGFIDANMIKENAIVIDIGINSMPDKRKKSGFCLKGDVKFDEVAPQCSFITPVPGGVGPMTVVSLLRNTLKAAKKEEIHSFILK